jgi:hypothetical protein
MKRLTLLFTLLLTSALTVLLVACEQQAIEIQAEHMSSEELQLRLARNKEFQQLAEKIDIELMPDEEAAENTSIRLTGPKDHISRVIQIAARMDKPQSYYLSVRNTALNTISTQGQHMRVLLHPEQKISLGYASLVESPWRKHILDKQKFLELELSRDLVLNILIKSQDQELLTHYSGSYPMQIGKWSEIFTESMAGLVAESTSTTRKNKRISTSDNQLWLRLEEADHALR